MGGAVVVVASLVAALVAPQQCAGLLRPVDGAMVASFAPVGDYGGHWGVDLAATPGTVVRAPGQGVVSFSGTVAGRRSVTIDLGGGVKASLSYLASGSVSAGDRVGAGDPIGRVGTAHGTEAVHFSIRLDGRYVDPMLWLRCIAAPQRGLALLPQPRPAAYPARRATRHPRRHIRSSTRCSPVRGRGGLPRPRPRPRDVPAGGITVAEGRSAGLGRAPPLGDDHARRRSHRVLHRRRP